MMERIHKRQTSAADNGPGLLGTLKLKPWLMLLCGLILLGTSTAVRGQDDEEKIPILELPLIDREPYDLLIVADVDGTEFDLQVLPFDFPDRKIPSSPSGNEMLRFRLADDTEALNQYEVAWRHVIEIRLFEQMLLDEGVRLIDNREADEAFRYISRLSREFPRTEGLSDAYTRFLYMDGIIRMDEGGIESALAVFEELHTREPDYTPRRGMPTVSEQIGSLLDQIVGRYVEDRNYRFARQIMTRIEGKYREQQAAVVMRWRDEIKRHAEEHRDRALAFLEDGEGRRAHEAVRQMLNVLPTLTGGDDVAQQVMDQFPLVIVAVEQPARSYDPRSIIDWSARRVGRLSYRSLVEYQGQGQNGGQYRFPNGRVEYGDDGKSFSFQISQPGPAAGLPEVDAYRLSRRILDLADPQSLDYRQGWRRLLESVEIVGPDRVRVQLTQAHVLPESMLQIPFQKRVNSDSVLPPNGYYASKPSQEAGALFAVNPIYQDLVNRKHPEIVELTFSRAEDSINALLKGDVDVIDRVFPGDVRRLEDSEDIVVERYQVPTVHMLIPNPRTEHMRDRFFRLALILGINRASILKNSILGGQKLRGFEVISGPFPIGASDSDPLNYGYNFRIEPKTYDFRLASTTVLLSENAIKRMLEANEQKLPPRPKLVIAHPATEIATVACAEIARNWELIGVETELQPMRPGINMPDHDNYDLLYAQISISEPLVDARPLLAENGIVGTNNSSIDLTLRQLDVANSWPAARRNLNDLHTYVHNEVIVFPLFQTVEYYAYRKYVRGVGRRLLSLYDNVPDWRVIAKEEEEEVAAQE